MNDIPIGTIGEQPLLVTPEWSIDFLGSEDARMLSTPYLIQWFEITARNTIKPFLAKDFESVGTAVNVRHTAAAPVGMAILFSARVDRVDGNRVHFTVQARAQDELIGEGAHERYVIHVPRFTAGLTAKRTRL